MTFSERMAALVIKQRYRENFNPSIMLRQSTHPCPHQRQKNDRRWTCFFPLLPSAKVWISMKSRDKQTTKKKSTCFPQRLCHFALCISNLPPSQNMIIHRSFGEGRDGGGYGPLPGPLSSQGPLPEDGLRRAMCRLSGERGV